jgi:hypothetical protein
MKKSVATLTATVALMTMLVMSSGAPAASAAAAVPTCSPSHLVVAVGKWAGEFATSGTTEEWLSISITNEGSACAFGGVPTIVPYAKTPHALESAALDATKPSLLTLAHGEVAFTYLRLEYRVSPMAIAKKWTASCGPVTASGFHITVGPAGHVLSRNVKVSLPEVCTTGKANDLHTAPLSLWPLNP